MFLSCLACPSQGDVLIPASTPWANPPQAAGTLASIDRNPAQSNGRSCLLWFNDVDIQLFHYLEHKREAVEERIDGDAQHPVGGGRVLDPQHRLSSLDRTSRCIGCRDSAQGSADEGRELLINLERPKRDGSESSVGEGDVEGPRRTY